MQPSCLHVFTTHWPARYYGDTELDAGNGVQSSEGEAITRMSEGTDWELAARAREGDRNAFAELVRRYEAPVIHFCMRMVGSRQDAEEIAQDSFVRVYRHLDRLKPKAKFSTLLFGIARNLALNALRDADRRGRDKGQALGADDRLHDEAFRPDRATAVREAEAVIEEAIARLSPEHREVIILRELQGLDYDAIARICGCRKGTVRSRLSRARDSLREQVEALGGREL
ncbi:MAG TPA: sigma-70 family RNA polymerase sigma factor [Candidatus Hydrogenedentes bacterium]|nr:sigma-70 family RNA polymerase sigma factor [Candidatus Hydrogenedentota bacterium]HPG67445.1 sigma-70 family RNA polymerase sigma factor [Candidatus Hydrogenedentota bacterium]